MYLVYKRDFWLLIAKDYFEVIGEFVIFNNLKLCIENWILLILKRHSRFKVILVAFGAFVISSNLVCRKRLVVERIETRRDLRWVSLVKKRFWLLSVRIIVVPAMTLHRSIQFWDSLRLKLMPCNYGAQPLNMLHQFRVDGILA